MTLLDTTIIIDWLRGNATAANFVNQEGKNALALNSVVVMELLKGARNKQELVSIKKQISGFQLLDVDQSILNLSTQLIDIYGLSHGISIPDAIIAATALVYQVELFSLNRKDFQMIPGLLLRSQY